MNYPLISEYIEAIKSAEDNFEELSYLRPILGDDGLPVMTSGNFAVVFKMKDVQSGKFYAVKCFTKEQEGRAEAYREITKELKDVSSPYLVSIRYLEKELFVDTNQNTETEFPVLLMDWVEGKTLDKYLRENLDDKYALEMLAYRFSQLAQWLIPQPFAHGDLKPENILVRDDGTLVLVDYDGMFVPSMKGQKARELGSPDFRHPQRTDDDFDEHIDDFPLICVSLSLKTITINKDLLYEVNNDNGFLFTTSDYLDIANSKIIKLIGSLVGDTDFYRILGSFFICIANKTFSNISDKLFELQEPKHSNRNYGYFTDPRDGYTYKTIKIGNQIWLAENLKFLPQIGNGYFVYNYYGNNVSEAKETQNYKKYGVLYNMNAAAIACPFGWRIPTDEDWKELERHIGMAEGEILKCEEYTKNGWTVPFRGSNQGSNLLGNDTSIKEGKLKKNKTTDYGFDAILGGWRTYHESYEGLYELGRWWSFSNYIESEGYSYEFYIYRQLFYTESGIGKGKCSEACCLSLRCIKGDSLPFPEMAHKDITYIPYPEPKDSVKKKIKNHFLQVVKDPYYNFLAILNSLISEKSSIGEIIRPLWIPPEINNGLMVNIEVKGSNVECSYSQNGATSSFISECNSGNIDDVVELTYELLNKLGLVGYFISNGSKAIKTINNNNLLNDREDDLPF